MKQYVLFISIVCHALFADAQIQEKAPDGGGNYHLSAVRDELSPEQRASIVQTLQQSEDHLRNEGKLAAPLSVNLTSFQWPLRTAAGFTDNGYYGLSNYVDQNRTSSGLLDYNCGNRTYDQHAGTDIATWPFPWQKMNQDQVEIIAAAAGTILLKSNGNNDQSCAFCTSACSWNAVYIMHTDGSVAWYGHLKNNSITSKAVGQTVAAGEYLGIVGSSGNSTGPHLHLEVYTNSSYTTLIDPYAGNCNSLNGLVSWWSTQQPYTVSTFIKSMTHGAPPQMPGCAAGEQVNAKVNFVNGEVIYFGTYYRDQQIGQSVIHTVYRPDNSVYTNWSQTFTSNFSLSYWWYSLTLPIPSPTGIWRYAITYNGQTFSTNFAVNTILPLHIVNFTARKEASSVNLLLETSNEENVSRINLLKSSDGRSFSLLNSVAAKNDRTNVYRMEDNHPAKSNFYKVEIVDKDGSKNYSSVKHIAFNESGNYVGLIGNPFKSQLHLKALQSVSNTTIELTDMSGHLVYSGKVELTVGSTVTIPTAHLAAGAYKLALKSGKSIIDRCTVVKQ